MSRFYLSIAAALVAASTLCGPAAAWSRQGHMLTAAIAFDDLVQHDRAAAEAIADLIDHHPDRGPFQVAAGRTSGDERSLRLFLQCARWPDDQRLTPFDHPTWHYAESATAGPGAPRPLPTETSGQAVEMLQLSMREATDPLAPVGDRALALCWVMHVAADIHQPLHTSTLYSATYPKGDAGGSKQFVFDPDVKMVVSLHWYWDDRVNKSDDVSTIRGLAGDLEKRFPRASLTEMDGPRDFAQWVAESHALAVAHAYPTGLSTSTSETHAPAVPSDYAKTVYDISARRMTLAGYRMADLLRAIAAVPIPKDAK